MINKASGGDGIPVELLQILKDDDVKSAVFNMSAHLENTAVATRLEKISFHSNTKERQCQRMSKLLHNNVLLVLFGNLEGLVLTSHDLLCLMLSVDCTQKLSWLCQVDNGCYKGPGDQECWRMNFCHLTWCPRRCLSD